MQHGVDFSLERGKGSLSKRWLVQCPSRLMIRSGKVGSFDLAEGHDPQLGHSTVPRVFGRYFRSKPFFRTHRPFVILLQTSSQLNTRERKACFFSARKQFRPNRRPVQLVVGVSVAGTRIYFYIYLYIWSLMVYIYMIGFLVPFRLFAWGRGWWGKGKRNKRRKDRPPGLTVFSYSRIL